MTIAPCAPTTLRPVLVAQRHRDPAHHHVTLSRGVAARLTLDGTPVDATHLHQLGLTMHQAWDAAACNLVRLAQFPLGTRFMTRPASCLDPGLRGAAQIDTPGADPTAWLAHPYSFSVLHKHLTSLCRGVEPAYIVVRPGVLLCSPLPVRKTVLARCATLAAEAGELPSLGPLIYRHGFASLE